VPMKILSYVVAAALAMGMSYAAQPTDAFGDGPDIQKPACEEGKCPAFTKGSTKDPAKVSKLNPSAMGRAVISDRCYVTRRDYCELPYYGVRGDYCECYDQYNNVYAGVVW